MPKLFNAGAPVRALIFDVDGTLYDQRAMRLSMLRRLLVATFRSPSAGYRTVRVLQAYRSAQEILRRDHSAGGGSVAQVALACAVTGASKEEVRRCVERWMEEEPLTLLPGNMRGGLVGLLRRCRAAGLRLAVLSDYPAERKLEAMGVAEFFTAVVSADDPEVGRFKPDPVGLQVTLARLGVAPDEAVYIGDRPDVDGAAAARAGIHFISMSSHARRGRGSETWPAVGDFSELAELVLDAAV